MRVVLATPAMQSFSGYFSCVVRVKTDVLKHGDCGLLIYILATHCRLALSP
jgi:hypothetical protein